MKYWLDSYGLQGTLLITGGLMFHLSAAGMLFRPPEFFEIKRKSSGQVTPSSDSIPVPAEVSQSENYNVEIAGNEMSTSDTAACKDTEVYAISVSDVDSRKDVTSRPESMRSYEAWSQWNILKHPLLYIYALTMPVSDSSFVNCTFMIYPYATDIGISKFDAVLLISIMGICSGAYRFLSGLFSDFNFIKKKNIYQAATLTNGFVICICPIVNQYVYLAIMSGLCGLFSGAAVVLTPVLVAEQLGTANIPVAFGVLYSTSGGIYFGSAVLIGKMSSSVFIVFLVTVFGGLLAEAADEWMDCGGLSVSSRHYRCCNEVPHPIIFGTREVCCGKDTIDVRKEQCCKGVASPKYANRYPVHCCGRDTYHDRVHMCCGDVVFSKVSGIACCGNEWFFRYLQSCRNGKLVDKKTPFK
ncbi:hypothetical protein LSAT2_011536 [Lamellibrachia satsuma]|nr:hypothetical protein LSAT2_011536 [Lamellibrachia satsuma]